MKNVCKLDDYNNPVEKVGLVITGYSGLLTIVEKPNQQLFQDSLSGPPGINHLSRDDGLKLAAIYSKQLCDSRCVDDNRAAMDHAFADIRRQIQVLNSNVKALGMRAFINSNGRSAPVSSTTNSSDPQPDVSENNVAFKYSLCKGPKDLVTVWNEYEHGIGGRYPAKSFTREQRGKVKDTFYLRNLLWQTVLKFVNAGHTAVAACDMVQKAYGYDKSVSWILKQMAKENKTGGNPSLRL